MTAMTRRTVLKTSAAAGLLAPGTASAQTPRFEISLAQWSLNLSMFGIRDRAERQRGLSGDAYARALREDPRQVLRGQPDPLDFPAFARRAFDINAVEYVNQFFLGRARDATYLTELKRRADGEGVRSVLIMCDMEGDLGAADDADRTRAVENHHQWVEAAAFLGCHSIRVNARSTGPWNEQMRLAADGLHRLADYGARHEIGVIVENHGGLSSHAGWLSQTLRLADHPNLGSLPDFGNFRITESDLYDPYQGVAQLMPTARGVSAKCYDFDDATGMETTLDFPRLLGIVAAAGYRGFVGIEYEGRRLGEVEGVRAAKRLLERIRNGEFARA